MVEVKLDVLNKFLPKYSLCVIILQDTTSSMGVTPSEGEVQIEDVTEAEDQATLEGLEETRPLDAIEPESDSHTEVSIVRVRSS